MGSMAGRVAQILVGGCALLLGVGVAACGASPYTDVSSTGLALDFKVPADWHQISSASLAQATGISSAGAWNVAYEAGSHPTASDLLGFGTAQPFVFAATGTLNSKSRGNLSYDELRDFFLPVTSAARSKAAAGNNWPFSGFKTLRDQVLAPGNGVYGVRETFDYTYLGKSTDTFDEIILARETQVYLLILHCTTVCYSANQAQINTVMSSFTVANSAPFVP